MTPDQLIEQCRLAMQWAESVQAGTPIEIQCLSRSAETWATVTYPQWDFCNYEYRKKPRPREAWVCWGPFDEFTEERADAIQRLHGGEIVHMREVIDHARQRTAMAG